MIKMSKTMLAVLLAATLLGLTACNENAAVEEVQPVSVDTATVQQGAMSNSILMTGTLSGVNEVNIVPLSGGTVERVLVAMGDKVAKDQLLFTTRSTEVLAALNQARAAYEAAQANYSDAKRNLERCESLYAEGAIAKSQLEQARTGVTAANPAAAQAALTAAQSNYDNTQVKSPIKGEVAAVYVTEGAMVTTPAVRVVDNSSMKLSVAVSENYIGKVVMGQEQDVIVSSVSDQPFTAKVTAIAPAADQATRNFPIELTIDNPDGRLKSGMFGELYLQQDSLDNTLFVVKQAIVTINGQKAVYLALDGKAVQQFVTTGIENEDYIEIKQGVSAGDEVVTRGNDSLKDGDPISVRGAAAPMEATTEE